MVIKDVHGGAVDVASLERGVQSLIHRSQRLATENLRLRTELARIMAEREAAEKAKNMARERVVAVLSRLKTLEK